MSPQVGATIGAVIGLGVVAALLLASKRIGALNAASWLVVWGAIMLFAEHPQFAISYTVPFQAIADEGTMEFLPHARIHFFMAGIYASIGLVLLGVIARTLLREGRSIGWYAVLFALLVGGLFDLVIGGLWFQHGSPIYGLFSGEAPHGFGWDFLYVYFVAWIAALAISFKPVFRSSNRPGRVLEPV